MSPLVIAAAEGQQTIWGILIAIALGTWWGLKIAWGARHAPGGQARTCRHCGSRARAGYHVCRKCGWPR
jgi:hypothetical protein